MGSPEPRKTWDKIFLERLCPVCKAKDSIGEGSHGGEAVHLKCNKCGQDFLVPYVLTERGPEYLPPKE